ncbi:right-handed parallel beta-helix repeat-containing protein [Lewinella sp. LCG006]|uniref:right-handed parallel beta-helix repeat-containing protein n=1 Tax=Lewinella sp. LCG006 TaxID=3231911 RepID=UPI003460B288
MKLSSLSFWVLLTLVVATAISLSSCDPDQDFLTGDGVNIRFELDTLRFDTVFTELGSATRFVKIYNEDNRPVKLDEIYVEGNTGVSFVFNADGTPGPLVEDVIIWDNDSIYVFVEVTIDPDAPLSVSPFVIEDRLVVKTGSKQQSVLLEAWGQNANYFPSRYNKGVPVVLSCDNSTITWDSPLPYVIYGEIFIDECLLEVAAGTHIYVHGGLAENELLGVFNDGFLFTLPQGQLHFAGTREAPITIEGDRLEEGFSEQPGQWLGIIIGRESQGNIIEHTTIKNSIFGVYADSAAEVSLTNVKIHTTASSGILGVHSEIVADNCLLYDNGANAIQLTHGGNYQFDYCTVASYGVDASALAVTNFQCYNEDCSSFDINPLEAAMTNCIFFGSRRDEVIIQDFTGRSAPATMQLDMDHCLVKVDELLTRNDGQYADFFATYCLDCVNGDQNDALFLNRPEDDYQLDTLSIAQGRGAVLPAFPLDLLGIPRDEMPDIGCFERVE